MKSKYLIALLAASCATGTLLADHHGGHSHTHPKAADVAASETVYIVQVKAAG